MPQWEITPCSILFRLACFLNRKTAYLTTLLTGKQTNQCRNNGGVGRPSQVCVWVFLHVCVFVLGAPPVQFSPSRSARPTKAPARDTSASLPARHVTSRHVASRPSRPELLLQSITAARNLSRDSHGHTCWDWLIFQKMNSTGDSPLFSMFSFTSCHSASSFFLHTFLSQFFFFHYYSFIFLLVCFYHSRLWLLISSFYFIF